MGRHRKKHVHTVDIGSTNISTIHSGNMYFVVIDNQHVLKREIYNYQYVNERVKYRSCVYNSRPIAIKAAGRLNKLFDTDAYTVKTFDEIINNKKQEKGK